MATTPAVQVERYADEYLPNFNQRRELARLAGLASANDRPLFALPDRTAVLVDTVQIYVRLLNYDDVRLERGEETAASHARALTLLGALYGAADRVVEGAGAQRVDYHGARLHAAVIGPYGGTSFRERLAVALSVAEEMVDLARLSGRQFLGNPNQELRFRVGIDAGPCVAISSGRSDEREPMFIGSAANHAAKLAMGDDEGIYLSDRVRSSAAMQPAYKRPGEMAAAASTGELASLRASSNYRADAGGRLKAWLADIHAKETSVPSPSSFVFHQHTPPLRSIRYAKLSPIHSIRMPLAALFADLDKYTAYIDHCMVSGGLEKAVRLLHVVRGEFNAVVQEDFQGRKVRFIGDCILAILADGDARETDIRATISRAALCAGALRSSFELCLAMLAEKRDLGLAIGFEVGPTPVSRIGIRGDRAVRVASSLAVRESEACQRECGSTQTRIGPNAFKQADVSVRALFPMRTADDLKYEDVAIQTDGRRVAATVAGAPTGRGGTAALTATAAATVAARPARAYHRE